MKKLAVFLVVFFALPAVILSVGSVFTSANIGGIEIALLTLMSALVAWWAARRFG